MKQILRVHASSPSPLVGTTLLPEIKYDKYLSYIYSSSQILPQIWSWHVEILLIVSINRIFIINTYTTWVTQVLYSYLNALGAKRNRFIYREQELLINWFTISRHYSFSSYFLVFGLHSFNLLLINLSMIENDTLYAVTI